MQKIRDKVNYVKTQSQTRKHACHWPDCKKQVPLAMWGCTQHWYALPQYLRAKIWSTFKIGQEKSGRPSREYVIVAKQVQDWIRKSPTEVTDD